MRLIDADALSAFVGDLRNTLHKEQTTFKAMTEIEFNTRDYMLLNFQQTIDNAPTVEACFTTKDLEDAFIKGKESGKKERPQGKWIMDNEHTNNPLLWYKCNLCGVYHSPTNFCPTCGAIMDGTND